MSGWSFADLPDFDVPWHLSGGDMAFPGPNGEWWQLVSATGSLTRLRSAPDAMLQHPEQSDEDWMAGGPL